MAAVYDARRFRFKLPTIWADGKAEAGRTIEEKSRRKKIRAAKGSEEKRRRCGKR